MVLYEKEVSRTQTSEYVFCYNCCLRFCCSVNNISFIVKKMSISSYVISVQLNFKAAYNKVFICTMYGFRIRVSQA